MTRLLDSLLQLWDESTHVLETRTLRKNDDYAKAELSDVLLMLESLVYRHENFERGLSLSKKSTVVQAPRTPKVRAVTAEACSRQIECASRDTRQKSFPRFFEEGYGLLSTDGRKVVEKLLEGIATFEIVEKAPNWHPGPDEDDFSAHDPRVGMRYLVKFHHRFLA